MEAERKTLRVMIVEDHAAFREALAVVLGAQPDLEVTSVAGSLAEGCACLGTDSDPVDVAIVDLGLPDGDGSKLVRKLAGAEPNAAVLALADPLEPTRREPAPEAEVLSKGTDLGRILETIRRLGTRRR